MLYREITVLIDRFVGKYNIYGVGKMYNFLL